MNNRVQSLLLNYHFALLHSGDFTLGYYQMGELEYIRHSLGKYHLAYCFYHVYKSPPVNHLSSRALYS